MKAILDAFDELGKKKPVVFPVHPRTQKNLKAFDLDSSSFSRVQLIDPVSYFDMLVLEKWADMILTDSGGMQKEAFFFQVPCVTLREETEWVETLESGQHILTGSNKDKIVDAGGKLSSSERDSRPYPYFGDGHAAERILNIILTRDV